MTPPAMLYIEPILAGDHDPLPAWTESTPGAVPYMLARPQSIETAPRDGTHITAWWPGREEWRTTTWNNRYRLWQMVGAGNSAAMRSAMRNSPPTKWLPQPPAPEDD